MLSSGPWPRVSWGSTVPAPSRKAGTWPSRWTERLGETLGLGLALVGREQIRPSWGVSNLWIALFKFMQFVSKSETQFFSVLLAQYAKPFASTLLPWSAQGLRSSLSCTCYECVIVFNLSSCMGLTIISKPGEIFCDFLLIIWEYLFFQRLFGLFVDYLWKMFHIFVKIIWDYLK